MNFFNIVIMGNKSSINRENNEILYYGVTPLEKIKRKEKIKKLIKEQKEILQQLDTKFTQFAVSGFLETDIIWKFLIDNNIWKNFNSVLFKNHEQFDLEIRKFYKNKIYISSDSTVINNFEIDRMKFSCNQPMTFKHCKIDHLEIKNFYKIYLCHCEIRILDIKNEDGELIYLNHCKIKYCLKNNEKFLKKYSSITQFINIKRSG